jgi:transposase-like protein
MNDFCPRCGKPDPLRTNSDRPDDPVFWCQWCGSTFDRVITDPADCEDAIAAREKS